MYVNSKCIGLVTLLLFHCMHVPFCSCPFILCLSLCFIVYCFFMFYGLLPEINHDDDDDEYFTCDILTKLQIRFRLRPDLKKKTNNVQP